MDLLLFICAWNCVKLKFCRFLYGTSLSQCSLNAILVGLCSAWGLKSIPSTLFFYFIFSIFSLIFLFLSSVVYFRIFLMLRFCLECLFPLTIKIIADNSLISRLELRTYAYLKETLASQLLGLPFHLKLPQSPTAPWVVIWPMSMVPLHSAWSSINLVWKGSVNCAWHGALGTNFPLPSQVLPAWEPELPGACALCLTAKAGWCLGGGMPSCVYFEMCCKESFAVQ